MRGPSLFPALLAGKSDCSVLVGITRPEIIEESSGNKGQNNELNQ
jgi:hypothetical protein